MLRRTKDATIGMATFAHFGSPEALICLPCATDGKPILNLPKRTVEVVSCFFDPAEREFYDAFEKKQELTFNKVG